MAARDKTPQPARRANQQQRAGQATSGRQGAGTPRTATVELPFVTAEFRMPELRMPELRLPELRMPDVAQLSVPGVRDDDINAAVRFVRAYLPPPQQAAYYTCLGVLGALQLVEWPVVLAIGAGTALSRQASGAQQGAGAQQGGSREAASKGSGTSGGSESRSR